MASIMMTLCDAVKEDLKAGSYVIPVVFKSHPKPLVRLETDNDMRVWVAPNTRQIERQSRGVNGWEKQRNIYIIAHQKMHGDDATMEQNYRDALEVVDELEERITSVAWDQRPYLLTRIDDDLESEYYDLVASEKDIFIHVMALGFGQAT